ncbi:MAG TPA: hypothetical protein VGP72_11605 [Planctomycetota bacterium]
MATEADLQTLIDHGVSRLRWQQSLRAALAALGLSVLTATLGLFLVRLHVWQGPAVRLEAICSIALLILPVLATAAAFGVSFSLSRPDPSRVALLMDTRAQSREHLVTWFELRTSGPPLPRAGEGLGVRGDISDLRDAFRAAQCMATLALASRFDPRKLLPMEWPAWTRGLWLAALLLCCALLMPPQTEAARPLSSARENAASLQLRDPQSGGADGPGQTPRVQVLTPTDLIKYQLLATDPDMPLAQKSQALKELIKSIGTVPESELAPEIRDILNTLRADVAKAEKNGKSEQPDGTQQTAGKPGSTNDSPAREVGVPANIGRIDPQVLTTIQQHFGDVKEQLDRYYGR